MSKFGIDNLGFRIDSQLFVDHSRHDAFMMGELHVVAVVIAVFEGG